MPWNSLWIPVLYLVVVVISFGIFVYHKNKSARLLNVLREQLAAAQNRGARLHEALEVVKNEASDLRRSLTLERSAKEEAVRKLNQPFSARTLKISGLALAFGLLAGSAFSGLITHGTMRYNHLQETVALQVKSQVAEAKTEFLEKRLNQLEQDHESLRSRLFLEMEHRALAITKLQVLLDHLGFTDGDSRYSLQFKEIERELSGRPKDSSLDPGVLSFSVPSM